jgi:hypothetical protein
MSSSPLQFVNALTYPPLLFLEQPAVRSTVAPTNRRPTLRDRAPPAAPYSSASRCGPHSPWGPSAMRATASRECLSASAGARRSIATSRSPRFGRSSAGSASEVATFSVAASSPARDTNTKTSRRVVDPQPQARGMRLHGRPSIRCDDLIGSTEGAPPPGASAGGDVGVLNILAVSPPV